MKTNPIIWLLALVISTSAAFAEEYDIRQTSDFYGPLSSYGYWVKHPDNGWCWRPDNVAADWRPYANGNWLWTQDGWYWDSDEPWAWACYHYGRWFWDERHTWLWQPGTEWAPAWVDWRESESYVGWAPQPPRFGVVYTEQIVIAPTAYVFVERRHFCAPIRPVIIQRNCAQVYRETHRSTRVHRDEHRVTNVGPRATVEVQQVQRPSRTISRDRQPVVTTTQIERVDRPSSRDHRQSIRETQRSAREVRKVQQREERTASVVTREESKKVYEPRVAAYMERQEQRRARHAEKDD